MAQVIDARLLKVARDVTFSMPKESRDEKIKYIFGIMGNTAAWSFTQEEIDQALKEAEKTF